MLLVVMYPSNNFEFKQRHDLVLIVVDVHALHHDKMCVQFEKRVRQPTQQLVLGILRKVSML